MSLILAAAVAVALIAYLALSPTEPPLPPPSNPPPPPAAAPPPS